MRIFIVEDHLMFREAIYKVCTKELGHEVVGDSDSGEKALEQILRLDPDIVILDLELPDMDGFAVADRLQKAKSKARILILSSHCDDYSLFRVEKLGVPGFIDKNANASNALAMAIDSLAQGRAFFSEAFQSARLARRNDPRSFSKVLSDHERAILSLIGQAMSDDEIAARLDISPRTAAKHRSNILQRLEIKNTPKLIAFANEHGFTSVPARRGSIPVHP